MSIWFDTSDMIIASIVTTVWAAFTPVQVRTMHEMPSDQLRACLLVVL